MNDLGMPWATVMRDSWSPRLGVRYGWWAVDQYEDPHFDHYLFYSAAASDPAR